MTLSKIIDRQYLKEVHDINAWFDHLRIGYIGIHSGNHTHLFIAGGDNNYDVVFHRSLNDDDLFKRKSFERISQDELYSGMTSSHVKRRYWVFDRCFTKLSCVKDTIYRVQGTDRVKKFELNKTQIEKFKYNEDLL